MRVALVAMETTRHNDTAGNRRFERLARQLTEAGHDVTVFCAQWWDGEPDRFEADGIQYRAVTINRALASFCLRLPTMLARYSPDVIHARPAPPQQVIAASVGGTLARTPLAVEWFGDESLDRSARLTRWAVTEPQLVITPSQMTRTEVRELGAGGENTRVVPEGIDFSLVESVDASEEVDVAYAHPLDESANIESLFLGLAELRDRDWTATIIGDGPQRAAYERQASDLRIDDRVQFVGACDREQRLAIYRGAHAFVQTAYREHFATELLWALAAGCVGLVEYQAESSAHELIENYERSFRVTNPQQLADAIVDAGQYDHLTVDETWREYDHSRVLAQYLDIYESLESEFGYL
ncbi:glycosyltransferase family 4 protein [Salinibaculum rarum]|uniref:glycosyltransferase family 4 protein n=1 Tax=Salinibaculum rarum TaxID=3058903 RepID=UPI00265FB098|nr:glycosyltransferase family 4 protein [Salinibaculum sp. KK48]